MLHYNIFTSSPQSSLANIHIMTYISDNRNFAKITHSLLNPWMNGCDWSNLQL